MRVPTCAYDARWGAYATISPSFGLEIVAPSRHNESYRPRCRAVRRGAECENGIWFAGMEMPTRSSQRTKYRSQMVLPRRPVIPANEIPFSKASPRPSPHPSKSNTILKPLCRGAPSSQQATYRSSAAYIPRAPHKPHVDPITLAPEAAPAARRLPGPLWGESERAARRRGELQLSEREPRRGPGRRTPSRQSYSALMEPSWLPRSCAILIPCM